ncbi:MAG: TRAP transporter TatT component family protein [Rectinemataceae bacterium]|jgi:predicted anti-sigma-YlaC factor YlaD
MVPLRLFLAAAAAVTLFGSCAVLGAASKVQTVLASEEDPEIAAAALPTFIMASEALLEADPKNQDKAVTTASLYVMYANAFVQGPASALPDERFEEKQAANDRAGALYRRAFRILSAALDRRSPGIVEAAVNGKADLSLMRKAEVPLLYWSAVSVLSGFGLNPLDFKSAHYLGAAPLFLARAAELDPGWNGGAIYGIYLSYYAGMPSYLGGDPAKAEDAYKKALRYSKGGTASLFVSYASSICVPKEDYAGFKAALEKALAIDPNAAPESRLETVIAQKNARRLLAEADKYFISPEGEPGP